MKKPEPHEVAGAKAARDYVLRRFRHKNTPFDKEPAETQSFYISQVRAVLRAAGRGGALRCASCGSPFIERVTKRQFNCGPARRAKNGT